MSAQGENLEVIGEVNLDIQFGENSYRVNAIVTPTLMKSVDIILGIRFLNNNTTTLVTRPGCSPKFTIDGNKVPMLKDKVRKGIGVYNIHQLATEGIVEYARVSKQVVLPSRSMGHLKLKIPYNESLLKGNVLFQPLEPLEVTDENEQDNFEVREGLIKVRVTGKKKMIAYIGYINHSDESKVLKGGEVIGGLSDNVELGSLIERTKVINNINRASNWQEANRWAKIKETLRDKALPGSEEEKALHYCLKKHQGVVQLPGEPFKTTDTVQHFIDYHGPPDLHVPQYNIPQIDVEDTEIEIDRLLEQEHIRPSKSGFNAPIIPVRKKDKSLRLVHDYRCLNKYTNKQRFPLPRIDAILAGLSGARYFCVLDLKSGYFQVRLAPASIPLTAFRTSKGCYEYVRMPFGLANAPSTMQRLMLHVVTGLPNTSVFLDDLLVYGATLDECAQNLDMVLQRLEEHKLTVKLEKCSFFKNSCRYLGHIISEEGIKPDPEKVAAVKDFPTPKDLQGVRSFLGLASYYRKFVKGYSEIAAPLHEITKGHPKKGRSIKIDWGPEQEKSFKALKDALTYNACLAYPDFELPFILTTDASDKACGGTLSQKGHDGVERPITFFSKKLLNAETRYDAISKECLGIIHGLRFNRPYILGREVHIASDNKPLLWLLQAANPSQRVARWQILISEYNIKNFSHVSGKSNVVADALSRHVPEKDTVDEMLEDIPNICAIASEDSEELCWNVEALPKEQDKVKLYKEIKEYLVGDRKEVPKQLGVPINSFVVESDILYLKSENEYKKTRYRTCLPPSYTKMALKLAHDIPISGHSGINGTVERIKKFAYWPNVNADVKEYVSSCPVCLKTKTSRARAPMLRNPEVMTPWDRINLDLIGPLPKSSDGNQYILSVVDVLTRYCVAVPMPDKMATTVTRSLVNHVFAPFGVPRSLYSDQGKEFVAQVTTDVLKAFGVKQRKITVYRPQASGMVERFNQHIVAILRALVHEHQESWDVSLPLAVFAHNTSYHRVLRESPYFLMFLRDANVPYETIAMNPSPWYNIDNMKQELLLRAHATFEIARKFLEEGKIKQESYANKKAKPVTYKLGDRVYVQKKSNVTKLSSKYVGPMRIVRLLGVIAWVKDLVSFKVYQVHINRLK